jgi:hypothetical protein
VRGEEYNLPKGRKVPFYSTCSLRAVAFYSHENSKSQKSKKEHNKIDSENSFFKKRLSL